MISILIPVYNYNLNPLVREIHAQAKLLQIIFEIIVIDDHSSNLCVENTNKELKTLNNVRYLRAKKNYGRSATRRKLAETANFDWLLFLDADVMPASSSFLKKYIEHIKDSDLVFGGIAYDSLKPEGKELRWIYGRSREEQNVAARMRNLYLSVLSGVIFIKKDLFMNANDFLENRYGLDVLFTANLKKLQPRILHIDNPAIHKGLETNKEFLGKTKKAMESIVFFAEAGKIPPDHRGIQKVALRLQKLGMVPIFLKITKLAENRIEKNLLSSQPSLRLFDFFRLRVLLLKQNENG